MDMASSNEQIVIIEEGDGSVCDEDHRWNITNDDLARLTNNRWLNDKVLSVALF